MDFISLINIFDINKFLKELGHFQPNVNFENPEAIGESQFAIIGNGIGYYVFDQYGEGKYFESDYEKMAFDLTIENYFKERSIVPVRDIEIPLGLMVHFSYSTKSRMYLKDFLVNRTTWQGNTYENVFKALQEHDIDIMNYINGVKLYYSTVGSDKLLYKGDLDGIFNS